MTLLKHPTAGTIVDVTERRATLLKTRGYTVVDAAEAAPAPSAPSAVQPQPPIDARRNPPEPPIDTRPDDLIGEEPVDTRPPNPLGPTSGSVEEADGAGLEEEGDADADQGDELGRPAKSASRGDWDDYARSLGLDPDDYPSKDDLIQAVDER